MLSAWDIVAGAVIGSLGVVLLFQSRRGVASLRAVYRRATRPIGELAAGPCEIAGTIHATRAAGRSLNGLPAVAVHTRVEALVPNGKSSSWVDAGACTDVATDVEVRDGSGACALLLEQPVVVGPMFQTRCHGFELVRLAPDVAARTVQVSARGDLSGYPLRVTQTVISDGAPVLVEGHALEVGLADGQGYRDVRGRYAVGNAPDAALLLSGLSHRATLWRAAWPVLSVGGAGALMILVGAAWMLASAYLAAQVAP